MRRPLQLLALVSLTALTAPACPADSPAQRRAALLELASTDAAAIGALTAALADENNVVRRTAARLLANIGKPAQDALAQALRNSDFVVRLVALRKLTDILGADATAHLATALADDSPVIRQIAVAELANIKPRTDQIRELLQKASQDASPAVREIAAKALWPFHKESTSIRDRKDWDHDIQVVQTIPLPVEGWRFALDLGPDGHLKKWYEPQFDDSSWPQIAVDKAWEEQGHQYDGVAWYRTTFALGEKPDCLALELRFGAVDECAWVWLNGIYVGQHDIGPEGWDKPFTLDVTNEVKWQAENQITVRVFDRKFAGGIWKPVVIEALK